MNPLIKLKINLPLYLPIYVSRDSSVGIATGYGLDDRGVGVESKFFFSPHRPDRLWGLLKSPIQWVPGVKRPGREADHSAQTSAEVEKMWIYTSTSPYAFMAYCLLVKHRDNITFLPTYLFY
jgi:hypothetical protein